MIIPIRNANRKRKALTLTELAIVLGAMGLVAGAIWGIASVVWDNYRYYKTKEQLVALVQNIRAHYGPMGGIYTDSVNKTGFPVDGTDITQDLNDDALRLIPVEMRLDPRNDTSAINHALGTASGGSVRVLAMRSGRDVRIRLLQLSRSNCIKLLMEFPVLMPEMAVTRMATGTNSTTIDITNISNPSSTVSLPMTVVSAEAWCSITTAAGNEVNFDFKIKN